jgi:hypothetical protein
MTRLRFATVVAVLGLGLLTACSAGGGAPEPGPGPNGQVAEPAGEDLTPTAVRYLWQQDALSDADALEPVLEELDEPMLVRTEAEWDAWWSDVPSELQDSALQSAPPDFSEGVAVVVAIGSCPPQSYLFTTTGAGEIAAEVKAADDNEIVCEWDPQAVYAFGFSFAELGVTAADDVTLTPQ